MSRRLAWLYAVLVLLGGSCSPLTPAERPAVLFWSAWPRAAIEPLLERFTAENPGIRVTLRELPVEALSDSAAAALAAGRVPDLCQLPGDSLGPWLEGGVLSDWSAGVADLRPALRGWEQCMVGDAIYGLPWTAHAPVLLYDRVLFARARLDSTRAPATWAELRSAAARLERLGRGVRGMGIATGPPAVLTGTWLPWAYANGGGPLSRDLDSSRVASRANEQALGFLVSLRPHALLAPRDSLEREFVRGRLGMLLADASLADSAERAGRRPGFDLVPRPSAGSGTSASLASGAVLVSFTSSRRKEDALRLARFLVQPEQAQALADAVPTALPARLDADSSGAFTDRPLAAITLRQLASARYAPRVRGWSACEVRIGAAVAEALAGRSPARALAAADSFVTSHLGTR